MDRDTFVTISEAEEARVYGKQQTLRRACRSGVLCHTRGPGRRILIDVASLKEWAAEGCRTRPTRPTAS